MSDRTCAVCGKAVSKEDEAEHLRSQHLGPHYFWFAAKKYRTVEPSMRGAAIKSFADANPAYHLYLEREGGDIPINDDTAVDLTCEPHLWAAPPATMWG